MKLPNAERAVVDLAKLRDYCLNCARWRGFPSTDKLLCPLRRTTNESFNPIA